MAHSGRRRRSVQDMCHQMSKSHTCQGESRHASESPPELLMVLLLASSHSIVVYSGGWKPRRSLSRALREVCSQTVVEGGER
jgi:hypothetical protein